MADDPDNLVLIHLREIRAQLQSISAQLVGVSVKLEDHDRRFDEHDRRFDEISLSANHALGLGATNFVKARDFEAWQRRADHRFDRIERRLGKVEERGGN